MLFRYLRSDGQLLSDEQVACLQDEAVELMCIFDLVELSVDLNRGKVSTNMSHGYPLPFDATHPFALELRALLKAFELDALTVKLANHEVTDDTPIDEETMKDVLTRMQAALKSPESA